PNGGQGVLIDGLGRPPGVPSFNTIGGSSVLGLDLISANSLGGVVIQGGATDNLIQNSYIGTDVTGTKGSTLDPAVRSRTVSFSNGGYGVEIDASGTIGHGNSVGGTISGLINVISGNSLGGVVINNGAL